MSDERFLKRWSRRKQAPSSAPEPAEKPSAEPSPAVRSEEPVARDADAAPRESEPEEDAIDPATLPPIESLGADSDYTVFLRKGVPEALRVAALRKAWMSDAFIRDFRSPAIDYGWDFTTPDYSLRAGDDVAKMLDKIFPPTATAADKPAEAAAAKAEPVRVEGPPPDLKLPQEQAEPPTRDRAAEQPAEAPSAPRRKHGGALPD